MVDSKRFGAEDDQIELPLNKTPKPPVKAE